jgi:hypothetical protein
MVGSGTCPPWLIPAYQSRPEGPAKPIRAKICRRAAPAPWAARTAPDQHMHCRAAARAGPGPVHALSGGRIEETRTRRRETRTERRRWKVVSYNYALHDVTTINKEIMYVQLIITIYCSVYHSLHGIPPDAVSGRAHPISPAFPTCSSSLPMILIPLPFTPKALQ